MTPAIWVRCLLVSACFALAVPVLTTVVLVPTGPVPDLSLLEPDELERMSVDEARDRIVDLPMRKLSLSERLLHPFSHRQAFMYYLLGVATSFAYIFSATVIVAYGIQKGRGAT